MEPAWMWDRRKVSLLYSSIYRDSVCRCSSAAPRPVNTVAVEESGVAPHYGPEEGKQGTSRVGARKASSLPLFSPHCWGTQRQKEQLWRCP